MIEQEQVNNFKELFFFRRYRDDCIVLWNGSKDRLDECFSFLNVIDCDLKFTVEVGKDHLCFLDLKISVSSNKLTIPVYSKSTDSHLYLHSTSCHKSSSINGIPKGVALRLRRICSTTWEYQSKAKKYSSYLVARGHNSKTVKSTFDKIEKVSCSIARKKKNRSITTSSVILSAEFNPRGPNVSKIINKHRHLLETDDTLK